MFIPKSSLAQGLALTPSLHCRYFSCKRILRTQVLLQQDAEDPNAQAPQCHTRSGGRGAIGEGPALPRCPLR